MIDDEIPANARGKWAQRGVPHKGWSCISTRDLHEEGEDYATCEMCESQTIRYVHTMVHADYPEALDCGCDCAGYMEGSVERARERDAGMKRRSARRQKFPDRKGWKTSAKGNPRIVVDGYNCVIRKGRGGYTVGAQRPGSNAWHNGERPYPTLREAQIGCFDLIEQLTKAAAPGARYR